MSFWNKFKEFWKKFWFIVWKDDSLKGWIISLLFILIIVKFVFFPLLNLATGTNLPLAIVESCSMYHQGNLFSDYEYWWDKHQKKYNYFRISKEEFDKFNFKKGFSKGDILFITKAKPEKIEIGDVIIFSAGSKYPIIHRVINIMEKDGKKIFSTIGDNNNGQLDVEKEIIEDQILGKARFIITPKLGWVKLVFFEFAKSRSERGFCKEN